METVVYKPSAGGFRACAGIIKAGGLVAFPTETVYGLGANAFDGRAAAEIFKVKGRPADNPLIVHFADKAGIFNVAEGVPAAAERLLDKLTPGPLTLVLQKKRIVPDAVTGGLDTVAVRIPADKNARAFIRACGVPLCAPSANLSGRPSPTIAEHVLDDLKGKIPAIIDGGACAVGVESTVLDARGEVFAVLRPGGVSAREIEKVCGVKTEYVGGADGADGADGQSDGGKPKSPGTKYKHYAPSCGLYFFRRYGGMENKINAAYDAAEADGLSPVIICLDKRRALYGGRRALGAGRDNRELCRNLFALLRRAEKTAGSIIVEGIEDDGDMSRAAVDRLLKACGGKRSAEDL